MLIESKRGKKRKLSTSPSVVGRHHYVAETPTPGTVAAHGNVYDPLQDMRSVPKDTPTRLTHRPSTSTCDHENTDSVGEPQETLYAQVLDKATNADVVSETKEGVVHVMYMGETFNLTHLLRQTNPESARSTRKRHYVVRFNPQNRPVDAVEDEYDNHTLVKAFLHHQDCFAVPDVHTCYQLFRAYFDFVHPHYPIVDRADFASQYADPTNPPSYLLLQSVLFMAAGHCDMAILRDAGFDSRYHARKTFFQRAKALYDNDHEPNKITVVQAVFLISFWWNGPTDQKDTWHWLGIAISLALTLGMHRSTQHSDMKPKDRSLWKRIWWSLFAEDKHAATALGRPVHIRRVDCDVEVLDRADFDEQPVSRPDIFGIPEPVDGLYVMALVELSFIAENIVHSSFTAFNSTTSYNAEMFQQCSEALEQWKARLAPELNLENNSPSLWTSMLHVAHRSITPQNLSPPSMKTAHTLAMDAANRMIRIVEEMLSRSHVLHCPIHIVPSLFAAMGMQAVDICSGEPVQEQLAVVKVRLAMIALRELQSTWPVSGWIFRLFSKIVRRIRNGDELLPNEPVNSSPVQLKQVFDEAALPAHGQVISQPPLLSTTDKPQYQDPALAQAQMYAMQTNPAGRYLFPEASNLAMPVSYPADWGSILDDGAWGDFEYEF
ncbi:hypothetical protein LTR46_005083 [Exophiala xenobiotica]|nr:hypothetical protein LTR46_005083 [Exophiala xenobiotica]